MNKPNPRISMLVTELKAATARMTPERRAFLDAQVDRVFPADVLQLIEELTPLPENEIARELTLNMREAVRVGFIIALARYQRELKANGEAMGILTARIAGAERGRKSQQRSKSDRIAQIQYMVNSGMDPAAIAADLKCSLATVYRALKPATSKASKAPKKPRRR